MRSAITRRQFPKVNRTLSRIWGARKAKRLMLRITLLAPARIQMDVPLLFDWSGAGLSWREFTKIVRHSQGEKNDTENNRIS